MAHGATGLPGELGVHLAGRAHVARLAHALRRPIVVRAARVARSIHKRAILSGPTQPG